MVGEIKWKDINKKELTELKDKLSGFKNTFIFVPDKTKVKDKAVKDILDVI